MSTQTDPLRIAVEREVGQVAQLLELLRQEYQTLRAQDASGVLVIAEEKQRLAVELEALGAERQALMVQAGVSTDAEGMAELLAQSADAALQTQWQRLGELLAESQAQNQRNGLLLQGGRHATEQALALLLGLEQPGTYDQHGTASQGLPGGYRTLGKV